MVTYFCLPFYITIYLFLIDLVYLWYRLQTVLELNMRVIMSFTVKTVEIRFIYQNNYPR